MLFNEDRFKSAVVLKVTPPQWLPGATLSHATETVFHRRSDCNKNLLWKNNPFFKTSTIFFDRQFVPSTHPQLSLFWKLQMNTIYAIRSKKKSSLAGFVEDLKSLLLQDQCLI